MDSSLIASYQPWDAEMADRLLPLVETLVTSAGLVTYHWPSTVFIEVRQAFGWYYRKGRRMSIFVTKTDVWSICAGDWFGASTFAWSDWPARDGCWQNGILCFRYIVLLLKQNLCAVVNNSEACHSYAASYLRMLCSAPVSLIALQRLTRPRPFNWKLGNPSSVYFQVDLCSLRYNEPILAKGQFTSATVRDAMSLHALRRLSVVANILQPCYWRDDWCVLLAFEKRVLRC